MSTTVQVSFGPTYEPTLWDLRKRVAAARKADEDLIFITVTAPITSEVIEVAIESGSLYLVGVRACDKTWWEFAPRPSPGAASEQQPRLPNSRWIMAGALRAFDSYRGLRLDWTINQKSGAVGQIVYADRQIELLRFFRRWDGQLNGYDSRYLFACSSSASVKRSAFARSRTLARVGFVQLALTQCCSSPRRCWTPRRTGTPAPTPRRKTQISGLGRLSCPI
jgi:hypothetical protein